MFIAYRKVRGIVYAYLDRSYRDENKNVKKEMTSLGRVLDKERNIFRSRERGVFTYDIKTGKYGAPPEDFVDRTVDRRRKKKAVKEGQAERKILNFGDTYFLNGMLERSGLINCIKAMETPYQELFITMIFHYILRHESNVHAETWYEGNYVSELFPKANPTSQRISEMMKSVGSEECCRKFYDAYFEFCGALAPESLNILIDSTGLPNSIHFPLTAVSNHNGQISEEVRLIYVTDQRTGLPVYMRYIPGNVVDVSTLKITVAELQEHGVKVRCALLDAGYCSHENLRSLLESNIGFITRLRENMSLYKQVYQEHFSTLKNPKHLVKFNNRALYIKRVACNYEGRTVYVYLCRDLYRQVIEQGKALDIFLASKDDQLGERFAANEDRFGVFMIISSVDIDEKNILDTYYTRQQIEQMFDISKNYCKLLPLAVHSEDTFRGHLMICFIASILVMIIMNKLKAGRQKMTVTRALVALENVKCKVFDTAIIAQEFAKKSADALKLCEIPLPEVRLPRLSA